jgi:hypothetical protein
MLARLLPQPLSPEHRPERQREAVVLPFSRQKTAAQGDWYTKYPCTRMHGADFEAEFYPASDQQS